MKKIENNDLIEASYRINSFADVIKGLIFNSIDAESNKIKISFSFKKFEIVIEDDGIGNIIFEKKKFSSKKKKLFIHINLNK